jgi:hypothetical protein
MAHDFASFRGFLTDALVHLGGDEISVRNATPQSRQAYEWHAMMIQPVEERTPYEVYESSGRQAL